MPDFQKNHVTGAENPVFLFTRLPLPRESCMIEEKIDVSEKRKTSGKQSMPISVSQEVMGCYFADEINQKKRRLNKSGEE